MSNDSTATAAPTRRDTITYGGAVVGGGLVAGCTGEGEPGDVWTATDATGEETDTSEDTSYSVSMEPMGAVEFDAVPEQWLAIYNTYADLGIALGQRDGMVGFGEPNDFPTQFYDQLPGIDLSFDEVEALYADGSPDKETYYELDADAHLIDTNHVAWIDDDWTAEDFDEIAENVGPIVGNAIRRRGQDWHDYRYYDLYEAFEKIAEVFQEPERYAALEAVHDDLISTIETDLPPEEDRATVGLLSISSDFEKGSFWAYPIIEGNAHKQYRDLGMRGAFDDAMEESYAKWDYEQILEIDPEALLFQYAFTSASAAEFDDRMEMMQKDPVGQELTAVQNGRLYRGGTELQGPIINLFQTEIAAKQFYPDTFGEWRGLGDTPTDEQLFDRQRVADIINGNH
ncbi:ferrichrome ABC transporter substrate-binding protein [Halobacteriales archaeon QS_1_69_70]|nr:MAG: ferrichrome ABC transporter substrate-binding protein [Halobacteriales archaeon QS_1_69_70]